MSPAAHSRQEVSFGEKLNVMISFEMAIALEECAKANGVSQAQIVREALADYLGLEG